MARFAVLGITSDLNMQSFYSGLAQAVKAARRQLKPTRQVVLRRSEKAAYRNTKVVPSFIRGVTQMKRIAAQQVYPATAVVWVLSSSPATAQPIEGQTIALFATALLVVLCAVGGFILYTGFKNRRSAKESEFWPTTGGKVLTAEVSKRTSRDRRRKTTSTYYTPNVRYSYMVAGQNYESTVIRFGSLEGGSYKKAEEVIARYPAGTTVVVRHDPADPSRATLETQSAAGHQILVGIVFIAALIIILAIMAVMFALGGG